MTWERDPLWAKARLFFDRAFEQDRDDPLFGLWCSLGLEVLARAAVASVSPTLLAEGTTDHKYLLHALGRGSEKTPRRSIGAAQVFELCQILFNTFSEKDKKSALSLVNRRNEELHSGTSAFDEYPPKYWLSDFYRICEALAKSMGESLESLFGEDEADVAAQVLKETRQEVQQKVQNVVAAHRKVFEGKSEPEKQAAAEMAEKQGQKLSRERHHRVTCPACGCVATVQGETFGPEHVVHDEDLIIVKQSVSPNAFSCPACSLKLEGYAALEAAQLGGHYTRSTEHTPEDYYGLIDVENFDPTPYVEEYLQNLEEYDNE